MFFVINHLTKFYNWSPPTNVRNPSSFTASLLQYTSSWGVSPSSTMARLLQHPLFRGNMIRLKSRRLCKTNSNASCGGGGGDENGCGGSIASEIKWELRPGGMLVQKRENGATVGEGMITVRVSTVSHWHDISIEATSTFGELKMILSMVTSLEPKAQRLLFRGKEREDADFLHMVGVKHMDKVLLLEDPANKERKLNALARNQAIGNPCYTISV